MVEKNSELLHYLMIIDGKRKWFTLDQAGAAYDNGLAIVKIGNMVMKEDGYLRGMTDEDIQRIEIAADAHGGRK